MKAKKCPVCAWEMKDDGIKVKVKGGEIAVCCEECAKKARENPGNLAGSSK